MSGGDAAATVNLITFAEAWRCKETDQSFRSFERSFSRQIHHRYNETRGSDVTGKDDDGIRVTRASSRGSDIDDSINPGACLDLEYMKKFDHIQAHSLGTYSEMSYQCQRS